MHLRAAKYKQSAGPGEIVSLLSAEDLLRFHLPVIIRSPSALLSNVVSTNRSTFAWVREDLRYEWKQS